MERNANYALVGLISTLLLAALMIFVVWLTNFALSAKYDQYNIVFHGPIRGLSKGGEVQFNGIKVGEVADIRLDKQDPNLVIALTKVTTDTPVREDSYATLEPEGITGVNYVQITAGTPAKPLLKDTVPAGVIPSLPAKRDTISDLLSGGGTVVQQAAETLGRINRVLSDENIKRFDATLSDIQSVTAELRERRTIIADAQKALQDADQAAVQIRDLAQTGNGLLNSDGKRTLTKLGDAATQIEGAASDMRTMLAKLQGPTSDFAERGLPQLTTTLGSLQKATDNINVLLNEVQQNPRGFITKAPAREVEVKP